MTDNTYLIVCLEVADTGETPEVCEKIGGMWRTCLINDDDYVSYILCDDESATAATLVGEPFLVLHRDKFNYLISEYTLSCDNYNAYEITNEIIKNYIENVIEQYYDNCIFNEEWTFNDFLDSVSVGYVESIGHAFTPVIKEWFEVDNE